MELEKLMTEEGKFYGKLTERTLKINENCWK
jgi:hypothetical protein